MSADDSPGIRRWRFILDVGATAAMLAASGVLIWAVISTRASQTTTQARGPAGNKVLPSNPLPPRPVSLDGAPRQGLPSATIAVIVYSDFECPYSVKFATATYPTILKSYVETGRVQLAFRHLPLEQLHPLALKAAEAAECGARQGKFWAMHDALFTTPRAIDSNSLVEKAQKLGLDLRRFERCMSGEATARVRQDVAEAKAVGITGTPTFLFGKIEPDGRLRVVRRESGAIPASVFASMLDDLMHPVTRPVPY